MSPMVMGEEKSHLSCLLSLFQLLDTFHLQLPTVGKDCGVLLLLLVSYAERMENINSSQISSGALSLSFLHFTGKFFPVSSCTFRVRSQASVVEQGCKRGSFKNQFYLAQGHNGKTTVFH